jgi:restriction system protein
MARKRSGVLADLIELTAMLPWWAGVALALLSYLFLSALAAAPLTVASKGPPTVNFLPIVASVLRFVLPLVFLVGAAASAIGRQHGRQLFDAAAGEGGDAAISRMGWRDFEHLLAEAYRRQGWSVVLNGGGGPDGGVDLVLRRTGEVKLVQAKHWKTWRVGVSVVRELYGVMAARSVGAGCIVTSGTFTAAALEFARGKRIELVDGQALAALLREASGGARLAHAQDPPFDTESAPACPKCRRPMVSRLARKGDHAGQPFWGCPAFPSCRGVRPQVHR